MSTRNICFCSEGLSNIQEENIDFRLLMFRQLRHFDFSRLEIAVDFLKLFNI